MRETAASERASTGNGPERASAGDARSSATGRIGTQTSAEIAAPTRSAAGENTFYRYRDASGRVVIVDSLARVPASARGSVEAIEIEAPSGSIGALPAAIGRDLHWPSFVAGAGSALLLAALLFVALRTQAALLRLVVLAGLVAIGVGAYFGWVRRTTGQDGSLLESPAALIDDARSAVEKMNARAREQEQLLRELEAER